MVYTAVGVSGNNKGENFRVMDRVVLGPLEINADSQFLWAYCRWAEEPEQWTDW